MERITVETVVAKDIKTVWEHFTNPESIKGWAFASDEWECPYATNDVRLGGRFLTRMQAKDGSAGFDFTGSYTEVDEYKTLKYIMDRGEGELQNRDCTVTCIDLGNSSTKVIEEFYPESENSIEMQKAGWQAILDNFKKFVSKV